MPNNQPASAIIASGLDGLTGKSLSALVLRPFFALPFLIICTNLLVAAFYSKYVLILLAGFETADVCISFLLDGQYVSLCLLMYNAALHSCTQYLSTSKRCILLSVIFMLFSIERAVHVQYHGGPPEWQEAANTLLSEDK